MEIVRWDPADGATLQGCLAVLRAAQPVDDPDGPVMSEPVLAAWLRLGWIGDPGEAWTAAEAPAGPVLGWYRLALPDLENRDRASLHIVVDPAHRRRGIGRGLLRHAAARAAAAGRVVLDGEVADGAAGDAFAAWAGATPGIAGAVRDMDPRALGAKVAELNAEAAQAAAGYSLVSWVGPTPPEYLGRVAELINAFADAPRDEGVEAELWDEQRVAERSDGTTAALGVRRYTIVAVHDGSGELAALTQLSVDPGVPSWGHQGLTTVTRPHRGHRLGLLVKTAMLQWLAATEPQVERIQTGNAASNSHMIAVNDALGFAVRQPLYHTVEVAVADVA